MILSGVVDLLFVVYFLVRELQECCAPLPLMSLSNRAAIATRDSVEIDGCASSREMYARLLFFTSRTLRAAVSIARRIELPVSVSRDFQAAARVSSLARLVGSSYGQ